MVQQLRIVRLSYGVHRIAPEHEAKRMGAKSLYAIFILRSEHLNRFRWFRGRLTSRFRKRLGRRYLSRNDDNTERRRRDKRRSDWKTKEGLTPQLSVDGDSTLQNRKMHGFLHVGTV